MSHRRECTVLLCSLALLTLAACDDDPVSPVQSRPVARSSSLLVASVVNPAVQIDAGYSHTCARRADGSVVCWGSDAAGQLDVPVGVTRVTQVSAGGGHSCAIRPDASLVCWGENDNGESTVPADLGGVLQVSAGTDHTCALKADHTVRCWGDNSSLQSSPPFWIGDVVQVAAGIDHGCALHSGGTVECWFHPYAWPPGGLDDAVQITAGEYFNCALRRAGAVTCWGWGFFDSGQWSPPAGSFTQVSAGSYHTCGVKTDATVQCWGGEFYYTGDPTPPAGLAGVVEVTGGSSHTCALRSDGVIVCWGQNGLGQLDVPPALRAPQSITFTSSAPNPGYVGDSYTISATGGGSGNPVTFSVLTPLVCALSGASVTFGSVGTCTIAADQAGGGAYAPAPRATQNITVVKRPQTITFTTTPPSPAILGGSYTVGVTGGLSGNPITLSVAPSTSACTLSGATVSFVAVGTCTVVADQAGSAVYETAQATQSFAVVYNFGTGSGGGFVGPVSNTTFNSARAGQSVPVSFNLGGDQGLLILANQYPKSVAIACPSGSDPLNVVPETTVGAGGSTLAYDPTTGLYTYVWKTDRGWAGTCREFILKLADNTEHRARFQFR